MEVGGQEDAWGQQRRRTVVPAGGPKQRRRAPVPVGEEEEDRTWYFEGAVVPALAVVDCDWCFKKN